MEENIVNRFWNKINKTDTCWLWVGFVHHTGYGVFHLNRKHVSVHRLSWELSIGL